MLKKITHPMIAALLCLALLTVGTFAWFSFNNRTPVRLEMLEIKSVVTLYRANDMNRNGVPEIAAAPVAMKYYTEKYDFIELAKDYAYSEETSADIALRFSVTDILPGEVRTFKFALENNGDADNDIHMDFDFSIVSGRELLNVISVRTVRTLKNADDGSYVLDTDNAKKVYFVDYYGADSAGGVYTASLPGLISATQRNDPECIYCDYWLQFCMEPLSAVNSRIEELNATRADTDKIPLFTEDSYNALAGLSSSDILFRINFDVTN